MFELMVQAAMKYLDGEGRDQAFLSITGEFAHFLRNDDFFDRLDSVYSAFEGHHTSESIFAKFKRVVEDFEPLRPGNQAPELALPGINGDTIRLSDQKGKVVYIDFWGTWCYPCLQEMPHSLELQEKFEGQPVEFFYVGLQSGDDQLTTWKEFVTGQRALDYAPFLDQREYPGTHLLSDGQFNNPALKPFKIRAAPTYTLIDAQGNIVRANAPRPSSSEIEELIQGLLAEL